MLNIADIISNNRSTYYNFATDEPIAQTKCNIIKGLLAISAACVVYINKDFIEAILSVYSILVGFSFNILFYLMSIERKHTGDKPSLERELKNERLDKLNQELFYNISYFTLVAIVLILLCLLFFLLHCKGTGLGNYLRDALYAVSFQREIMLARLLYNSLLFLVLIESVFSFFRTMGRVNYYFSAKIKSHE